MVVKNKMIEHLKQDVTRLCASIIYELADINEILGRTVGSTLQVPLLIKFGYILHAEESLDFHHTYQAK